MPADTPPPADLLDRLPISVARFDNQLRITYLNTRLAAILGVAHHDALGRTCLELGMSSEAWVEWEAVARLALNEGRPSEFEYSSHQGDREHLVQYRFAPVSDPPGLLVVAVTNDEVPRLRVALSASERLFGTFMEAMPLIVWLRDSADRYVYLNPHYCHVMGIAAADWIGKHPRDVWPPEVVEQFLENDRLAARSDGPIEVRETTRTSEGELRHWMNVKFGYRDATGERLHGGIGIDITRQTHAEDERRRLEQRLFQSQKLESIGLMAGSVAHDFSNLLTAILGNLNRARAAYPPGGTADDSLARAELAAHQATALCKQMLAFSGRGARNVEAFEWNGLVREVFATLETILTAHAVVLLELAEGPIPLRGDATQLHQVVMNLLTNASESLGEGTGSITIRTSRVTFGAGDPDLPAGDYARLEVSDTGPGMDEDTQARIFEPFFTTKVGGRGLGLAAVQGILRDHGGAIRVDSRPGQGSRFAVFVPILFPEPTPPPAPVKPRPNGAGRTVLIVDDEPEIRSVIQRLLEAVGFRVRTAADGVEAVGIYRDEATKIDLILLDWTMPRLSGGETFYRLRSIRADAKILMLTGLGRTPDTAALTGAGLTGFVPKPFRVEELLDGVFAALG